MFRADPILRFRPDGIDRSGSTRVNTTLLVTTDRPVAAQPSAWQTLVCARCRWECRCPEGHPGPDPAVRVRARGQDASSPLYRLNRSDRVKPVSSRPDSFAMSTASEVAAETATRPENPASTAFCTSSKEARELMTR